jgi:hypothetical protein
MGWEDLMMKSSALASTSSSPSITPTFPSLTVAGRRVSTISSSSKYANADLELADFFIFLGSFTGISPDAGLVSERVLLTWAPCSLP